jgi:hypothetical protein
VLDHWLEHWQCIVQKGRTCRDTELVHEIMLSHNAALPPNSARLQFAKCEWAVGAFVPAAVVGHSSRTSMMLASSIGVPLWYS